jgi:hypothetical protein
MFVVIRCGNYSKTPYILTMSKGERLRITQVCSHIYIYIYICNLICNFNCCIYNKVLIYFAKGNLLVKKTKALEIKTN